MIRAHQASSTNTLRIALRLIARLSLLPAVRSLILTTCPSSHITAWSSPRRKPARAEHMATYGRSDVGLSLARRWRVHWRAAAWRLVVGRPVVIGVVVGAIRVAVMVRRSLARVGAARCVVGVALRVHSVRHGLVLTVTHVTAQTWASHHAQCTSSAAFVAMADGWRSPGKYMQGTVARRCCCDGRCAR
jgi:hypothetical protein